MGLKRLGRWPATYLLEQCLRILSGGWNVGASYFDYVVGFGSWTRRNTDAFDIYGDGYSAVKLKDEVVRADYPNRMNKEERSFAELLDQDNSGVVKWWSRNPENEPWATRLMLPSGKRFFPDFVVGVAGRTSQNSIALIEIKDGGTTGRLQSNNNFEKIRGNTGNTETCSGRTALKEYGLVLHTKVAFIG